MLAHNRMMDEETILGQAKKRIDKFSFHKKAALHVMYVITPQFKENLEHQLALAVIRQTIADLVEEVPRKARLKTINRIKGDYRSAVIFLQGDMRFAELCGINADWIRRLLKQHARIDVMAIQPPYLPPSVIGTLH